GGDPPAETETHQREVTREIALAEQPLVDDRDVAHAAHPVRSRGAIVARMRRRQHTARARDRVVERRGLGAADVVVKDEHGWTGAGVCQVQADASDGDGLGTPGDRRWAHGPGFYQARALRRTSAVIAV